MLSFDGETFTNLRPLNRMVSYRLAKHWIEQIWGAIGSPFLRVKPNFSHFMSQIVSLYASPVSLYVSPDMCLDIQVADTQGIVLDEVTAFFHNIAHQLGENLVCCIGLADLHLQK